MPVSCTLFRIVFPRRKEPHSRGNTLSCVFADGTRVSTRRWLCSSEFRRVQAYIYNFESVLGLDTDTVLS